MTASRLACVRKARRRRLQVAWRLNGGAVGLRRALLNEA